MDEDKIRTTARQMMQKLENINEESLGSESRDQIREVKRLMQELHEGLE